MNEQALRFRLGIFVLGAFILLGVLIVLFGGLPDYFRKSDEYTIVFDSAPGVSPGTPVRRSGVRIGEVSGVRLDDDTGKVHVTIEIDAKHLLRRQDQATLTQGMLGGDSTIDFVARQPDGKKVVAGLVEPGDTIMGTVPPDAGSLVQKTSEAVEPAKETMAKVREFLQEFQGLGSKLEKTLKRYDDLGNLANQKFPKTNDEIRDAAKKLGKAAETVDRVLFNNEKKFSDAIDNVNKAFNDQNQKNLAEALESAKKLGTITTSADDFFRTGQKAFERFNESLKGLDVVIDNMRKATKPYSERSESTARNFDESADKLNKLLAETRELIQAFARSDGTVQKLITDPSLYDNLNATACMMTRIIPRLDRIMRDLEIFADKLARHPEAIGLGGVIRPGSGLKDAPTVVPWRGH